MNKSEIWLVLQSCLLFSEMCTKDEVINYGLSEPYVSVGYRLFHYLKDKEVSDD